jgi:hypothetical protein
MLLTAHSVIATFTPIINAYIMENISVLERKTVFNNILNTSREKNLFLPERSGLSSVLDNLLSRENEDFYNYILHTGLNQQPNFMLLSSISHYYYDYNDLKGIRTLINLKHLNNINHIDSFLHILYSALSPKTYFLGCFKSNEKNGIDGFGYHSGKLSNMRLKTNEPKIEKCLKRKGVISLLEAHGFKVIDITELNNISYFCSRIMKSSGE